MLSISRMAWLLLVLALVGAVAGLFGPHERVGAWTWAPRAPPCSALRYGLAPGCSPATRMRSFRPSGRLPSVGRGPGWTDLVELDERDLRMRHFAVRAGDWALTLGVIAVVVLLAFVPAERLAWWLLPLVAANMMIGFLLGRSFLEHALLVARCALERR